MDTSKIKTKKYKLYQGDCLKILPKIKTKIRLVLTDPPYERLGCKWDTLIPFDEMWKQIYGIIKSNAAILLFGNEPFTSHLIISNEKDFKQKLIWLKTRPTNFLNAKKQFMYWTEDICVFYKNLPVFNPIMRKDGGFVGTKTLPYNTNRSNGYLGHETGEKKNYTYKNTKGLFYPKTVLEFSNVHHGDNHYHPTQKPVPLLEYLIKTYTNENEVVLDFTMGSGSTGVACMNTNRRFIGIEKDEKYFDISVKRIKEATKSLINMSWMQE